MTHHGRRSQRARERRLARRVVQNAAWFDDELAESINVLTPDQIGILTMKRGAGLGWSVHVGTEYEKGEVIRDVRGRGSLQKVPVPKSHERLFKRMQRLKEERRLARLARAQSLNEPNGHDEPELVKVKRPGTWHKNNQPRGRFHTYTCSVCGQGGFLTLKALQDHKYEAHAY